MSAYDRRGHNYYNESYERSQNKKKLALFLRSVMAGDGPSFDWNTDARMLFDAIRKGKLHMIRFIMEAAPGDLANSLDIKGKTPLMVSCTIKEELRRSMTARLLISYGADVNAADDDGRTVLSHACEMRCNDVVDLLVKHHNIDPDIPDNKGNTALMYSSMIGNDVATDILIRHFRRLGLNVDRQNGDGFTALLMAAKYGNITCAKILIEQGRASLRHRDRIRGGTTEDWLKKNGFTLEDVTPLTTRMRQNAMYMRPISNRCYSVPNELYGQMDDDDDDEVESLGCFRARRQVDRHYQRKFPHDLNPISDTTITEFEPLYRRPRAYSQQMNKMGSYDNDVHTYTSNTGDDNMLNDKQAKSMTEDTKNDQLASLKLPDIKIHKSIDSPILRQNMLNADFKTCCPEKVPEQEIQRSRSSEELRRWQPHFDHYSLEKQEALDDLNFDHDSGTHDMLD